MLKYQSLVLKKNRKFINLSNYFLISLQGPQTFLFEFFMYLSSIKSLTSFLIMFHKILRFFFCLRSYFIIYLFFYYFRCFSFFKKYFFYVHFCYLFLTNFIVLKRFLIEKFVQNFLKVTVPYSCGFKKYLLSKTLLTSFGWLNLLRLRFTNKNIQKSRRNILRVRSKLQKKSINFFKIMRLYYSLRLKQFIQARWKNIFIFFLSTSNNFFITIQDVFGNKLLSLTKASLKEMHFRKRSPLIVEYLMFELFFTVFSSFAFYKKEFKSKEAKALVSRVRRAVYVLRGQETKFTPNYLKYLIAKYRRFTYKFSFIFQHKGRAYNSANFFLKRLSRTAPIRYKVFKSLKPFNGCRMRKQRRL